MDKKIKKYQLLLEAFLKKEAKLDVFLKYVFRYLLFLVKSPSPNDNKSDILAHTHSFPPTPRSPLLLTSDKSA